jgi:hypothetical protein
MVAAFVQGLRRRLARDKWALVKAADMRRVLSPLCATSEAELAQFWNDATPQVDEEGRQVYPHKGTLTSYYGMSGGTGEEDGREVARVSTRDWPAAGNGSHVVENIDPTTINGGSSSYFRIHKSWPKAADQNVAVQALLGLVHEVMEPSSSALPDDLQWSTPGPEWEAMMSAFRVNLSWTGAAADESHKTSGRRSCRMARDDGDPGPEGVHQDDADLTVVVLMDRANVAAESGGNRIWALAQPCGKVLADESEQDDGEALHPHLLGSEVMCERFDALFILDRQVKHEALPIRCADESAGRTFRDVLTLEVRRPSV